MEGEVEGVEKKAGNEVGETGCEEWEAGVFVEESIAFGRPSISSLSYTETGQKI